MKNMRLLLKKGFIFCFIFSILPLVSCNSEITTNADPTLILVDSTAKVMVPTPTPVLLPEDPAISDEGEDNTKYDGIATAEDMLPMHNSYAESKAINDDVIGWIEVSGTNIKYPVTRCEDNFYYMSHNVEKEKSKYGCIFMDFRNADEEQRKHIVLYGHNMKNGTMFHDLVNYKQRDFFNENRYINFIWDGVETKWEVFCAYTVITDYIYPIHTRFISEQDFADVMNDTMEYAKTVSPSNVDSSVTIQPTDQVITLLTCTYEYDNSRFAVMARRLGQE